MELDDSPQSVRYVTGIRRRISGGRKSSLRFELKKDFNIRSSKLELLILKYRF